MEITPPTLINELIHEAHALFDQPEKWSAYLEMEAIKKEIIDRWYDILYRALESVDVPSGWACYRDEYGIKWYLKAFERERLGVLFYKGLLCLEPNQKFGNIELSYKTLESPRFEPLYKHIRSVYPDFDILEIGNSGRYHFDTVYDHHFDRDTLAWFAGNRTAAFAEQVKEKLRYFLSDEVTELITALNQEANQGHPPYGSYSDLT